MIDDSLQEGMASEPDQDENKIYVPMASLGMNAKEGDEVSFTVKGNVESMEGDKVCVRPSEINGQPADMESEHDKLARMASEEDGYGG